MEKGIYLIYHDDIDDACDIKGYIIGTWEDAEKYCDKLNEENKYGWQDYEYCLIENLIDRKDDENESKRLDEPDRAYR